MRLVFPIFIIGFCLAFSASENHTLDKELKEISGWVFINDSTLVAHNDSGNDPKLFVLNEHGKIQHKITLLNIPNIDCEDIAFDGKKHIYLGDFGNNSNNRKDLVIYKISVNDILKNEDTEVEKIQFSYPEQKYFPAPDNQKYYDCEAMAFYDDSLYLFTKCRTEPFDGKCMVYQLPTKPGKYDAKLDTYLVIGKRDWFRDAITAADIQHNKLYLLTYNRVIVHSFKNGKAKYLAHHTFNPISQKEALAVNSKHQIYVGDERQKMLGGGHLYILEEPKSKKEMKLSQYKAVIYDMDGVLTDSEPIWKIAMEEAFHFVGCPLTRLDFQKTVGLRIDEVVHFWYHERPWTGHSIKDVEDRIVANMVRFLKEQATPLPGVLESLAYFKEQGLAIGLATSSYSILIDTILEVLNIRHFFQTVHSAEFETYGKPHPAVYLTAAKQLNVEPKHCLVIEDSLNGVISGKAARMTVICVPEKTHVPEPKLIVADHQFDTLNDLITYFKANP